MGTKKKITAYLYSQTKPLEFESEYFYESCRELSDERVEAFVMLGDNYIRKSDISKIIVETIKEPEVPEVEEKVDES